MFLILHHLFIDSFQRLLSDTSCTSESNQVLGSHDRIKIISVKIDHTIWLSAVLQPFFSRRQNGVTITPSIGMIEYDKCLHVCPFCFQP